MDGGQIKTIRSFNRVVAERIGALNDKYLARARPLGASRVLWEIAGTGTEVRTLRSKLNLDPGYLSRLLHALERDYLIELKPDESDSRARTVHLTRSGIAERGLLDKGSDELAASLLSPLDAKHRHQLVTAVGIVERLLTVGMVQIAIEDPASEDAEFCINRYFLELDTRFESGFDATQSISASVEELTEPAGLLLVARLRDEPVGCGALKFHDDQSAVIKRMWVANSSRGLGLGRRILTELEQRAAYRGVTVLRLDTNQSLTEAINLYRNAGYSEVGAFNDEPFAHHWFEKSLEI